MAVHYVSQRPQRSRVPPRSSNSGHGVWSHHSTSFRGVSSDSQRLPQRLRRRSHGPISLSKHFNDVLKARLAVNVVLVKPVKRLPKHTQPPHSCLDCLHNFVQPVRRIGFLAIGRVSIITPDAYSWGIAYGNIKCFTWCSVQSLSLANFPAPHLPHPIPTVPRNSSLAFLPSASFRAPLTPKSGITHKDAGKTCGCPAQIVQCESQL